MLTCKTAGPKRWACLIYIIQRFLEHKSFYCLGGGGDKETGIITEWIQNSHFTVAVVQVYAQTCLPAQQNTQLFSQFTILKLKQFYRSKHFFFFFYFASWSLLYSQLLFKWERCPGVTFQRVTHKDGNEHLLSVSTQYLIWMNSFNPSYSTMK